MIEKIIDSLHWKRYRFIGQDNAILEGSLTQESEELIAHQILDALFKGDEKGLLKYKDGLKVSNPLIEILSWEFWCKALPYIKAQKLLCDKDKEGLRDKIEKARAEIAELSKKLDDREVDLTEAVEAETRRIMGILEGSKGNATEIDGEVTYLYLLTEDSLKSLKGEGR
ncbi:hypothetical protein ES703_119837 [subsurface metagenome]